MTTPDTDTDTTAPTPQPSEFGPGPAEASTLATLREEIHHLRADLRRSARWQMTESLLTTLLILTLVSALAWRTG